MAITSKATATATKVTTPAAKAPAPYVASATQNAQLQSAWGKTTRTAADTANINYALNKGWTPTPTSPAPVANKIMPDGSISAPETAMDKYWQNYNPQMDNSAEEARLRQAEMEQQAKEISGIDAMYSNLFSSANQDAARRLATTEYVNGMSGLGGSNIAASNNIETDKQNAGMLQKIKDAHGQEVGSVVDKHRVYLADQIKQERDLRNKNYEGWVNYQSGKEDRAKNSVNTILSSMVGKYKPDQIDDKYWEQLSAGTNMSAKEIKAAYSIMHSEGEASSAKAALDKLKTSAEISKLNAEAGKIENQQDMDLKKENYQYLPTPQERDAAIASGRKVETINGRTYIVPENLTYEQKKAIDAKYAKKTGGTGSGGGGAVPGMDAKTSTAFWAATNAAFNELQQGANWGSTYDKIKKQFPNAPADYIDTGLHKGDGWDQAGHYQSVKASASPDEEKQTAIDTTIYNAIKPEWSKEQVRSFIEQNGGNLASSLFINYLGKN